MLFHKRVTSFLFIIPLFLLLFPAPVVAQSRASASIRVSPVKFEMPMDPGGTFAAEMHIENLSELPANITLFAQDFTRDEGGAYTFYNPGERDSAMSAAGWLELPMEGLLLDPGERRSIPVKVKAPGDAEPGGHYAMLFVEADPVVPEGSASSGSQIAARARIGTLILATVSGDITRAGTLKSFTIPLFNFGDVPLTALFMNEGNVHLNVAGLVTFRGWRGNTVSTLNIRERTSLPDSKMVFWDLWEEERPLFGRFSATVKFATRDGMEWLERRSFWIIPLREVGGILAILLFVGGVLYFLSRKFSIRVERKQGNM